MVTSFANHAAIAFEQAILFGLTDAELQKRVRFLSALNQVGRSVSQSLLLDEIHHNAIEAVFEVMPADACWIYLQREADDFLRLRAHRGVPEHLVEQIQQQPVEYGQGAMGNVAQSGQPLFYPHLPQQAETWQNHPILIEGGWQSLAVVPLHAKESVIGVLGMATHCKGAFTIAEVELLQAIGDQIARAVVNARLYRRSRDMAILEERNRMAREIHDTLAQGFLGILVQLQAAERIGRKKPEKALQSLQEARELARESLQEARRSVQNLRPTVLEDLTLDQAILKELDKFEQRNQIQTELIIEGYPSPLHPNIEQHLYRITQEALTNIKRHAQAASVTLSLIYDPTTVTLSILDDGIGLSQASLSALESHQTQDHFGLVGIRERAELIQGHVTFERAEGGGTRIEVVIAK